MYSFEETVMFSRTDVTGAMSLKAVIDDLQDVATAQSNSVGYSFDKLREMGAAWVLSAHAPRGRAHTRGHHPL